MYKLKVASHCRVSTNHKEQQSSLETQISYYGKLIAARFRNANKQTFGVHEDD